MNVPPELVRSSAAAYRSGMTSSRVPFVLSLAAALLACACTTTQPGWTGSGATPLETAEALCRSRAREVRNPEAREAAFLVCMSEHGWSRTRSVG